MKRMPGKRNEDYLEAIYLISKTKRIIRIKDIAKELQVKKSTVVSMIEKLSQNSYIKHEKYGDVFLTDKGINKAQEVYNKHVTIYSFLKDVLNIDKKTAEDDACNLEHHISNITINKLLKFIEFFLYSKNKNLSINLNRYFETGEYPETKESNKKKIQKLSELNKGEKAKIVSLKGELKTKNYFISNGIVPGAKIDLFNKDNKSNSIEFYLDKLLIKLNINDAKKINVEKM